MGGGPLNRDAMLGEWTAVVPTFDEGSERGVRKEEREDAECR